MMCLAIPPAGTTLEYSFLCGARSASSSGRAQCPPMHREGSHSDSQRPPQVSAQSHLLDKNKQKATACGYTGRGAVGRAHVCISTWAQTVLG